MIEVTDKMIYAFAGEPEITATDAHAIRLGLAAVLAIVEHEQSEAAKREWDALQPCPSESPTDGVAPVLYCEREAGHDGAHGAYHFLTSWRDLDQAEPDTGSNPSGGEAR